MLYLRQQLNRNNNNFSYFDTADTTYEKYKEFKKKAYRSKTINPADLELQYDFAKDMAPVTVNFDSHMVTLINATRIGKILWANTTNDGLLIAMHQAGIHTFEDLFDIGNTKVLWQCCCTYDTGTCYRGVPLRALWSLHYIALWVQVLYKKEQHLEFAH